jgi:hypothetical protein
MLSDFFARQGINANDTLLIRHTWHDISQADGGKPEMLPFTARQKVAFEHSESLWLVFTGEENGTTARFCAAYKNLGVVSRDEALDEIVYGLEETDVFSDLRGRLLVDWGNTGDTRNWHMNAAKKEREILEIQALSPPVLAQP